MGNWRIWQSFILVSAFGFKILILGTLLTLASHNICLDQLLDGEIKWSQLAGKQRKRNDESNHNTPANTIEIIWESTPDTASKKLSIFPLVLLLVWMLPSRLVKIRHLPCLILQLTSRKIFITHCSLLR